MSTLLVSLPPLAPDYSGVASVMHDMEALTVIHDASGCTGTYAAYDEPRWFGSRSPVFCSGLRDLDAVMGDDDKLLAKIEAFIADSKPPLIAVIGSPVPMVVGFDFAGFAALVESRTGIPSIGFPTNGLGTYDTGQAMAYGAMERRFVADRGVSSIPRGVNLLGASPLDDIDARSLDEAYAIAAKAGLDVISVWGSRSRLDELRMTGSAAVNWVMSSAAIPLARRLEARFGQRFVVGLPIGDAETSRILGELRGEAAAPARGRHDGPSSDEPASRDLDEGTTLVVAEAVCAASIVACLRSDLGVREAVAATMFAPEPTMEAAGVLGIRGEEELAKLLADPRVVRLAGDPLLARLAPKTKRMDFLPLPHRGVSARLHGDSRSRLFGAGGVSILDDFIGGNHD